MVRGAIVLPNGTGKSVRVAVFAQGDKATQAKDAGADIVGMEDLAEAVKNGELNFDLVIATPDSMRLVGQLGQILGPRGLMPNPRLGTVTQDVSEAVSNAKAGQVMYRTDKNGIVHGGIGKVGFDAQSLQQNLEGLIADLKKSKPLLQGHILKENRSLDNHGCRIANRPVFTRYLNLNFGAPSYCSGLSKTAGPHWGLKNLRRR